MIQIEHLEKHYHAGGRTIHALQNIHLQIQKGQIFGIIGRSGAGKSTLLRTLNLLERPSAGKILIEGEDITQYDSRQLHALRQRTGMVFQHFNLLYAKTIADNIDFPLRLTGQYSKEQRQQRVTELLELVGLTAQRHQYPAQLSGGQKQRVGIARALANYPHLLLCDEATSALDPETTQSILRLLSEINQKLGLTIVLITHEMQVIRSICDQVAVIDAGQIVENGPVTDVFLHPQHPVTRSMVAENQDQDIGFLRGMERDPDSVLMRLTYVGSATYAPILSRIAAQTSAEIAILQGTISRIKDTPYGQLLIELRANPEQVTQVLSLLRSWQVTADIIETEAGVA
ncbi:methionine ABC transporter ATP-binding protein [Undibacterium griseum]|uniref:ATP-binding cassette domain-containing protein n=1 Tax=Undibacterium griseum TaxID=2762295 RepID=A0ABR6YR47_9BURK|nr:ATP-binding cassette domain-containing protein [Undibacterium griseum]MBC3886383.1 ATP-binding cassette domain-containing protein [Undibacterium griseum]